MTKPIARDPIYRRRGFDAEIIELCVRWYISYRLSYRDLAELMVHYHEERNHQGWGYRLITNEHLSGSGDGPVQRRARLGGTLSFYKRAAA